MSHTVSDPRRYWTDEREQGKARSGTCRSAQHITASVPKSALPTTLLKHHLDSVAGDYHGSSWEQCGTKTSPYGRRPDRLKTVFHDPNTSTLNNKIKKKEYFQIWICRPSHGENFEETLVEKIHTKSHIYTTLPPTQFPTELNSTNDFANDPKLAAAVLEARFQSGKTFPASHLR